MKYVFDTLLVFLLYVRMLTGCQSIYDTPEINIICLERLQIPMTLNRNNGVNEVVNVTLMRQKHGHRVKYVGTELRCSGAL